MDRSGRFREPSSGFNQITRSSYIRSIPHSFKRKLCLQLDAYNGWKEIIGRVTENGGQPRYNDMEIRIIEGQGQRRGSPSEEFLNDWQTQLPTIGDLLDILEDAQLYDISNFVRTYVGEPEIPQPERDVLLGAGSAADQQFSTPASVSINSRQHPNVSMVFDHEAKRSIEEMSMSLTKPIEFYHYHDLELYTDYFDSEPLESGGRLLGKGGYGEVFLGAIKTCDSEPKLIAVKRFHEATVEYLKQFQKEFACIIPSCEHANLLKIEGVCLEQRFCVIYEYMDGFSLEQRLEHPPSEECRLNALQRLSVAIDVAKGIAHLHSKCIVHRDIKSANILMNKRGEAKVGDFGLARVQQKVDTSITNKTTHIHGSTAYMPPESKNFIVSPKWDVYSFGVVLLELLFGKGPVYTDSSGDTYPLLDYIFDEDEREILPDQLIEQGCGWDVNSSQKLIELAEKCSMKKAKRPGITEVLEILIEVKQEYECAHQA